MSSDNLPQREAKDGRWTKEEHQKFLMGLQIYGRNWKQISKLVVTRSGSQIRSHAQKYFEKLKKASTEKENSSRSQESPSPCEEESTANYSYFFSEISKLSMEMTEFKFWDYLIGTGEKNSSAANSLSSEKLKVSFTPYDQQKEE